jgi:holo-[acyl-carrier protein] synthase
MQNVKSIIGVGCDLVDIERIKSACEKNQEGFLTKILTPSEISYCHKYSDPFGQIAARFAAKEAVSKALGCGLGAKLGFLDIEIFHDENKKPHVRLSFEALKRFGAPKFEISLTHTHQFAQAYVIAFI